MRSLWNKWIASGLIAAAVLCTACNKCDESKEMQILADAFQQANQADSIEPMLELYCLDGVDARTLTRLKGALKFEHSMPIRSITFEPLTGAPEECIRFVHDNVTYGPSLRPSHRMRIIYDQEDDLSSLYTIGCNSQGDWKIVCARPIQASDASLSYTPSLR